MAAVEDRAGLLVRQEAERGGAALEAAQMGEIDMDAGVARGIGGGAAREAGSHPCGVVAHRVSPQGSATCAMIASITLSGVMPAPCAS